MLGRGKVLGGDGFESGCWFKVKDSLKMESLEILRSAVRANSLVSEKNYPLFLLGLRGISSKYSRNFQNRTSVSAQMTVATWWCLHS